MNIEITSEETPLRLPLSQTMKFNHDFDWDNVEVLDEKLNYNKRLISEMIHQKNKNKG